MDALQVVAVKRQFHTLDGLRGVAALAVVVPHFAMILAPITARSAFLAVDLFFLMSGFVLAHAYGRALTHGLGPGGFLLARLVRLYPLYLLGTLIAATSVWSGLAFGSTYGWTWSGFARALLPAIVMLPWGAIPDYPHAVLYPLNFPAWSLLAELLVNVVYAAIAGRPRTMIAVCAVCGMLLAGVIVTTGTADHGSDWPLAWVGLFRVGFSFFLGVLMHRMHRHGRLPPIRLSPWLVLVSVAMVLFVTVPRAATPVFHLAAIFVLFPVLLCAAIGTEPGRAVRFYAFLGAVSYPIYAVHMPAYDIVTKHGPAIVAAVNEPRFAPWTGVVLIGLLVTASWMLARYFDPAARRLLRPLLPPSLRRRPPIG